MSTTKTFRLTHRVARGLLIATDTIATNSYWMVDTTHPAWQATVDRLGGVNLSSRGFTSWAECRSEATDFDRDLGIGTVFDPDGREVVDLAGFEAAGWEVHPDWAPVMAGYVACGYLPPRDPRSRKWAGQVGLYDDDGRLVGVVVGRRRDPFFG